MLHKNESTNLLNVLLIDEHPYMVELYKNLICGLNPEIGLNFIIAKNCEDANNNLEFLKQSAIKLNIAIIEIGLPPFKKIENGADIATIIKKDFPNCKIIVVTAFKEPLAVYNLLQKTTIEAVLCKSDMDNEEFIKMYESVINCKTYRSKRIQERIASIAQNKFDLDFYDLQILQRLQEGKKTRDLINYISLSLSTIEKRKANLKRIFLENGGTDKNLIEKLKSIGILN
jgi:DNA-binding NarL/FixJ family response regulator